jgi:hypothetical protein
VKNCVKVFDISGEGFLYLRSKFWDLSNAKLKQGILVRPQIRWFMFDDISKGNWIPLNWRCVNCTNYCFMAFWATKKEEDYPEIIQSLLQN